MSVGKVASRPYWAKASAPKYLMMRLVLTRPKTPEIPMTAILATAVVPTDDQLVPDDDTRLSTLPIRRSGRHRKDDLIATPAPSFTAETLAAPAVSTGIPRSVAPTGSAPAVGAGVGAEELGWITSHS